MQDMDATVHGWIANARFEFVGAPFKIGLATTCCGSAYAEQLRITLPLVQMMCMHHYGCCQQALILSRGDQDTMRWVADKMQAPMQLNTLRVGLVEDEHFHAVRWKNAAHKLASEQCDVLINVDCTRILGADFPQSVLSLNWDLSPRESPTAEGIVGVMIYSTFCASTFGTIGMPSWLFLDAWRLR